MSGLDQSLADYLTIRRALGYKLERAGKLLAQFIAYLEEVGAETVTIEHAIAWATLPANGDVAWWASFAGSRAICTRSTRAPSCCPPTC